MSRSIFTIVLVLLIFGGASAGTIKVPTDYATIQAGIDAAVNGDTVLVATGTYYENINFKGKAITVASHFLVDGDTTHINNTIIDGSRPSDPNKGSVVSFTSGEDTMSVICGFTITGGTGTISEDNSRVGGGIFCFSSGPRIAHNKITNNTVTYSGNARGAGVGTFPFGNDKYALIENNIIELNSCFGNERGQGGGIYMPHGKIKNNVIQGNSCQSPRALGGGIHGACDTTVQRTLHITGNTVMNNQCISSGDYGGWGGGIDVWGGIVAYITDNTISHNSNSAVMWPYGGGMRLVHTKAPSIVQGNTFSFNSVTNQGGGGGIELVHTKNVQIIGNRFEGNDGAACGGGIDEGTCSGNLIAGNFFKNNTGGWGGGICATNSTVINNIIVENKARRGGGIFCFYDPSLNSNLTQLINNTITKNVADTAGSIAIYKANTVVMNTICWGNTASHGPEIEMWGGTLNAAYSDIRFGANSIAIDSVATVNWLAGNIDANPLFAFSSYQLSNSSPCIGAGTEMIQIEGNDYECPNSDIEGNLRPDPPGSMPDIGAYENPLGTSSGPILVPEQYLSIQAGINAASDGDVVLVRDNTYYENINFKGKAITVASYYLVDGDTTHINNTIIDGSLPIHADSGSVVCFVSGEDTTSILSGFTITGGSGTTFIAIGTQESCRGGGGIFCYNSGARITHNKIVFNNMMNPSKVSAGGGIGYLPLINSSARYIIIEDNAIESNSITSSNGESYLFGGGILIVKGRVTGNTIKFNSLSGQPKSAQGGGISARCQNTPTRTLVVITGNTITHNQAITPGDDGGWGGGIDVVSCNAQIWDNTISHNKAGGSQGAGAGIRLWGSREISLIKDNTISYNSISMQGFTAGIELDQTKGVQVVGNIIQGNNGPVSAGGGIDETNTSGNLIKGNLIKENIGGCGGGIWAVNSKVVNNIIVKNVADWGGGIFCYYEASFTSNLTQIINNTITNNVAKTAGGIAISKANIVVMNTICWGNTASHGREIQMWGGILNAANSDIRFGSNGIAIDSTATVNWLATNIDADPLFADTLFHLSDRSPCIGRGIASLDYGGGMMCYCPDTDIAGSSRPDPSGSNPDIGAYESPLDKPTKVPNLPLTEIPQTYSLAQNYPNPFNPATTIEFALPKSAFVTLKVYNLLGEEVATLIAEQRGAGIHRINWDARGLASGIYLYRLEVGSFLQTKKLILMR